MLSPTPRNVLIGCVSTHLRDSVSPSNRAAILQRHPFPHHISSKLNDCNHAVHPSLIMDPLSITAAVASIVFTLVKTGKQLHTIFDCFQEAQHSLFMIQTECTVIAAALSQVQIIFSGDARRKKREVPETILDALELSLIGYTMTLSVLTEDVGRIVRDIKISKTLKRKQKTKYVWKQDKMTKFVGAAEGPESGSVSTIEGDGKVR